MLFPDSKPDVIQAINHRWLLKLWSRNLGKHRVPQWQAVEGKNVKRLANNLGFLDVADSLDGVRFLIRFFGTAICRVYGLSDPRGRYLDEVVRTANCPTGLRPYYRAVETGRPVYTIHDFADRDGRLVHSERSLLPFSSDGERVTRLLAAFEFVSPDGAFDQIDLLTLRTAPPALRMSATIAAHASA
jgi:hypothetical protein